MQLTETSSITIHADEFSADASSTCSPAESDPEIAAVVARLGDLHTLRVLQR
jgi:hypothetical protein